jgi:phosphomannomutase
VHVASDAEALVLAAALIRWLQKEVSGARRPQVMVAHGADPASASVAAVLATAIIERGGDVRLLETPLTSVLSHAIIADGLDAGILVSDVSEDDERCRLTLFGADGRALDATPARQMRTYASEGAITGRVTQGQLTPAARDAGSYARALADALGLQGHTQATPSVSLVCVASAAHCGHIEAALALAGAGVEVTAASETDPGLDARLGQAIGRARERKCELAIAFDDTLGRIACATIVDGTPQRLGDDEMTEVVTAWILTGLDAQGRTVTLVSDIGSTRAIDALAERFNATLIRTLPGADAVAREVAHQRRCGATTDTAVVGITADATLLMSDTTGTPCPVALACALVGAAIDAHAAGGNLTSTLRALDDDLGCHRATHIIVAHETPEHAPLLLMRLRKDERELICHMVVTDTQDFLTATPMPGDPTRTLPFFDALGWTLSDGSTLILYADEAASCTHALVLARADTRAEAEAVSFFIGQEAHEILTS